MGPRLPLVEPHAREHTYCAYCPKLCRSACPVSTEQGRESTTPWGKMTSLHHVANQAVPFHESYAATWYACTGCMKCRSSCAHGNEVSLALSAGRSEAVAAEVAPAAAVARIANHAAKNRRATQAAAAVYGTHLGGAADTVFVPGCTVAVTAPTDAADQYAAVQALAKGSTRVEASECCGLPLLEAGDQQGFRAAAKRFMERLGDAKEVVFGDPGCMHTLVRIAPTFDIEIPAKALHLTEFAARAVDQLQPRPALAAKVGTVRYHDACRLGRGLGVYDAPRQVLERILGTAPQEFDANREHADCSGAGGQLPTTDRATASAIARSRVGENRARGGGTVVTTCAASKRAFAKQGAEVADFSSILKAGLPDGRP